MEFKIFIGSPPPDKIKGLKQYTIQLDDQPFAVVYGPDLGTAYSIANGIVAAAQANKAFTEALTFIAGVHNNGRPVGSAIVAKRVLDAVRRKPHG